jgi:hypothetical protein
MVTLLVCLKILCKFGGEFGSAPFSGYQAKPLPRFAPPIDGAKLHFRLTSQLLCSESSSPAGGYCVAMLCALAKIFRAGSN